MGSYSIMHGGREAVCTEERANQGASARVSGFDLCPAGRWRHAEREITPARALSSPRNEKWGLEKAVKSKLWKSAEVYVHTRDVCQCGVVCHKGAHLLAEVRWPLPKDYCRGGVWETGSRSLLRTQQNRTENPSIPKREKEEWRDSSRWRVGRWGPDDPRCRWSHHPVSRRHQIS